jgi:GINS complex subunit 2
MALNLKTKKKCHIVAPYWLNVGKVTCLFLFASYSPSADHLQDRLNRETSEPGFSDLPFHFTEVSKVLLDVYVTSAPSNADSPDIYALVLQMTWKILTSCVPY